ncbi:MAG: DUF1465 family protein [Sphingomonas fennica]
MSGNEMDRQLTARLVDGLYAEAMLLADEARHWFDQQGREVRAGLSPLLQVEMSCEALRVTTRLMHVIAWLLNRRALAAGEIGEEDLRRPANRLGPVERGDPAVLAGLPADARALIEASRDLHERVARLDARMGDPAPAGQGPARGLFRRLEDAF